MTEAVFARVMVFQHIPAMGEKFHGSFRELQDKLAPLPGFALGYCYTRIEQRTRVCRYTSRGGLVLRAASKPLRLTGCRILRVLEGRKHSNTNCACLNQICDARITLPINREYARDCCT